MLIEWIKILPGLGEFIIKIVERRRKRKQEKAHKRYAIHISPGRFFIRDLKSIINKNFETTKCDHIIYLSYHNGTENAIGVPYEKFDLCVFSNKKAKQADFMPGISGIVQEYDVLDIISEDLIHKYSFDKLVEIDPKFANLLNKGIENIKYIVTSNIRANKVDRGCMIFVSTNKQPDLEGCINCANQITELHQNN